jgi:DNA modification methylase
MASKLALPANRLILGDNLHILKTLEEESVDLIYLDPPFFSNRNYEVIWGDANEMRSFEDRWMGGIEHYIAWLKERVELMYRVLKKTGSIFLHCDWHADAYIRVEILDRIFGAKNFRSDIIWKRQTAKKGSQFTRKSFGNYADTSFFYSKSGKYYFQLGKTRNAEEEHTLIKRYNKVDADGRRFRVDHIELIEAMARQNLVYEYKGYTPKYGWMMTRDKLEVFDNENRIYWSETGKPYRKYFFDEYEGKELTNIWDDITIAQGSERIGYPTQKPEALLERIIQCASNEGDLVLDPFMGGGTTIAVAERLGRHFIGIDQSAIAVKVTETRLHKQMDTFFSGSFSTELHKYDYKKLRYEDAFEFEEWIVRQVGGTPNTRKRGDFGIDGKMADGTPIQVKRSDGVGRNVVDNFLSAVKRADKKLYDKNKKEKKPIGCMIAFSFNSGAREEAARLKIKESIILDLKEVKEVVPLAEGPAIKIKWRVLSRDGRGNTEIELTAKGEGDSDIGFYSWDWDYDAEKGFKATEIRDETGRQTHKFNAGVHTIAVKAVDNEGLESVESIKLKVNGTVKSVRGKHNEDKI